MSVVRHFALAAVLVVPAVCAVGEEAPVAFWASDPVRPGEVVVVQGGRWGKQPEVEVSSSPWRTEYVDRIDRFAPENIGIARMPKDYAIEAVVPLELLGLKPQPGKSYKIDFGILSADSGGSLTVARTHWAWQFDVPEQGQGMVQAFRRSQSNYEITHFELRGLDAGAEYVLTNVDTGESQTLAGRELLDKGLAVPIADQPGSAVIVYKTTK